MKKILNILENRLVSNSCINNNDIAVIIDELIRLYELESFIKNIYFVNKDDFNYLAYYNRDNFSLVFVMNKIYETAIVNYNHIKKNMKISFNSFYNHYFLMSLFHEIKHVMQFKKLFLEEENDFIVKLYNIDEVLRTKGKIGNNSLYISHHDLFPCEREANIFSVEGLISQLVNLDRKVLTKDELKYFQMYFINLMLTDYKRKIFKVNSPFESLIKLSDNTKLGYVDMVKDEYLSLYERLSLGLPISTKEYDRVLNAYYLIKDEEISLRSDVKKMIVNSR